MPSSLATVAKVLEDRGPLEIFTLAAAALALKPVKGRPLLFTDGSKVKPAQEHLLRLIREILGCVKRGEHGLRIIEYPTYRLKGPIPKTPARGRYLRFALETLAGKLRPLSLDELTACYVEKYGRSAIIPEFWMFTKLQSEGQKLVAQAGVPRVGLSPQPAGREIATHGQSRAPTPESDRIEPVHAKIYEENLESLILERLGEIEVGLTLVKRQYVTPVGRIDVLCRDRKGHFVVIELKRFRASSDSIIDQVTRYMGWVGENLAKRSEAVRAYIIVGKLDKKLEYSVRAIRNLKVKCFRVALSDPE